MNSAAVAMPAPSVLPFPLLLGTVGVIMGHKLRHSGDTDSRPELHTRRAFLSTLVSAAILAPRATGQQQTATDMTERFRQRSEDFERKGLAEPFKGITTNGNVIPDLFEIGPTGVSTEPVRNARTGSLHPSLTCSSPGPCSLSTTPSGANG